MSEYHTIYLLIQLPSITKHVSIYKAILIVVFNMDIPGSGIPENHDKAKVLLEANDNPAAMITT